MVDREYRSKKRPKVRGTLERLRVQAKEPRTITAIQDWLHQTTATATESDSFHPPKPAFLPLPLASIQQSQPSVLRTRSKNSLPLQPIHGNQAPPLPRTSLKRRMAESIDKAEPRQSARIRNMTPPALCGDILGAKGGEVATTGRGRTARRPTTRSGKGAKEGDVSGVGGPIAEGVGISSSKGLDPGTGRPANELNLQTELFNETAAKHKMSMSTPRSPSKKSGSPSKSSRVVDKRERMQFLIPRVVFRTLIATKNEGRLSGKLQRLWLDYINWDDKMIIPTEFKEAMKRESDTPNKTRPSIPDSCFGASHARYAREDYALLQLAIPDVLSSADKYRHSGCTEAHWISVVVSPLLNLVRRLQCYQKRNSKLAVVDLTAVEISPSTLCPTSSESLFKNLDKRIDAAIGLDLSPTKEDILIEGVYSEGSIPSINQTANFVNFVPMFANVEVKRPNTDRDPLIQLGAWIAAEFTKRQREGYSLDMPVLAIEIEGDTWNLHMVFAIEDGDTFQCHFVGPIEMGSTKSVLGIFQILDRLCRCTDWGIGEYQAWFEDQVLSKYGEEGSDGERILS